MIDVDDRIVLIDYALAHRFRQEDGKHIPEQNTRHFKGTWLYCSRNTLLKMRQTRRDDLESLLYMVMRLVHVRLPWQHLANGYDAKTIRSIRSNMSDEYIEEQLPKPFRQLYCYVRSLKFSQKPNYDRVVSMLEDLQEASLQSFWLVRPSGMQTQASVALRTSVNFAMSGVSFSRATGDETTTKPLQRKK